MEQETITSKKKKWYRRKLFYALVVVGLLVVSIVYGKIRSAYKQPVYETTKVERGVLTQTVDAAGNVESADELDLRFDSSGRLGKIYKDTNEPVKVGDVIAELDLGELNARVAQSSASVAKAKANLDKVLAGETNAYISNLKAKLDQAQATLNQVKATSADTVANAQAALDTAHNNLTLSEGGENSQIVQDTYDDMIALLLSIQNTLSDGLTSADNVVGIDNIFANDEFESVLSTLDGNKLNMAKNNYSFAKNKKQEFDNQINTLGASTPHDSIDSTSDLGLTALSAMKDLLFAVSETLNVTVPIGDLNQAELDALKTTITTARTNVNTNYTSLINQKQAIDTAQNSYDTYVVAYNKAVSNLENARTKAEADTIAYQALVDQAQAAYDDVANPPRTEDVASARAQLSEAQAGLAQAVAARNKGRIVAPVDGVVGKVNGKVGEYISSQDTVVKLVSPHFEVKVDIPETDIIKIALGVEADITLDAYGDETHFTGRVSQIEIGETVIQDVIYYTVTVSLEDKDENHKILNGMTANVVFYTEEKDNVLFIPQRVIRTEETRKYVRVLENGDIKEIDITTGLRGDGGYVEVLSGLVEGQEIVVGELAE